MSGSTRNPYQLQTNYLVEKVNALGHSHFWDKFATSQKTGNQLLLSNPILEKDAKSVLTKLQLEFGDNAPALDIIKSSTAGYVRIAADLTKIKVPTSEHEQKKKIDFDTGKEYIDNLTRSHFSENCPLSWEKAASTQVKSNPMSIKDVQYYFGLIQEISGPNKKAFSIHQASAPDSQGNPLYRVIMDINSLNGDQLEIKKAPNKPNLVRIANFLNEVHSHDIKYGESSTFPVRWALPTDDMAHSRFESGTVICKGVSDTYFALGQDIPSSSAIKKAVLENFSDKAKAAGFNDELIKKFQKELKQPLSDRGGYHGKT